MAIQSGNYGRLLEPGLRKIFFETYKEKPEQYSQVLNVLSSKKAIETDLRMGGFHMWNEKGSLDATEYEDPTDTQTILYKHTVFSKGFQVEKELVDDEQYTQINKMPKALARAARATIETKAAAVFNNAFTVNGYDGVPLISAAHKPLDGGANQTNLLDGNPALSESAIELAFKLAREQADETGLKIQMVPKTLIVGPKNEFLAQKIAQTERKLGTDYNDINAMKGRFNVIVLDYLTEADAWFLLDSDLHQLNFFWREKLNFKNTTDFDTDVAKYKGRMRFSTGYSDFRGVIGSRGTGV